jgi:endogenous inhibitor of DNA gyrase (YacG/DUF329 family)
MKKVSCPICQQEMRGHWSDWPHYPFCSRRCRLIDLGRWLREDYTLPADDVEDVPAQQGEAGNSP